VVLAGAEVNPLDAEELPEWPWYVDPLFLIAALIIAVAVWWVWSGRAPH
jgi:Tfp pilus assembly protein PilO